MRFWIAAVALFAHGGCATGGPFAAEPLRDVFRRVKPAVVVVETRQRQVAGAVVPGMGTTFVSVEGLGSGVLIEAGDRVGVFTAAHVVQAADAVAVRFAGEQVASATVASSWPAADVALLEIVSVPEGIAPVMLGDSDAVEVGDPVFVVGAPHGLSYTLTTGTISARRRASHLLGMTNLEMFQTDAAINAGNSGGPMFNERGEVIAIVSHILTRSGGFEGTGFAITSNVARRLLLEEAGFWSGMDGALLTGELARILNVPQPAGMLVQSVARGSPAEKIGLRPGTVPATIAGEELLVGGDIILAVAGVTVDDDPEAAAKIRARVGDLKPGEPLAITVLRQGKLVELSGAPR